MKEKITIVTSNINKGVYLLEDNFNIPRQILNQ